MRCETLTPAVTDHRLGLSAGAMSAIATRWPSRARRAAHAWPMLAPPPVTTATRPLLSRLIRSSIGCAPSLTLAPASAAGEAAGALTSAANDCRLRASGARRRGERHDVQLASDRAIAAVTRFEEMLVGTHTDA